MPSTPRLRPPVRPLRRGPDTIQLGLGPHACVLTGLTRGEQAVLARLDGAHPLPSLYAAAARHGEPARRVDALVALLARLDLLDPDHTSPLDAEARPARVLVGGAGQLTEAIAASIRSATGADVRSGEAALGDTVHELREALSERVPPALIPELVVLPAPAGVDPARGDPWLTHGVAHLAVVVEGGQATVGPLVGPPLLGDEPCLRCVELARCGWDDTRAAVLAQAAPRQDPILAPPVRAEPVLAELVCGLTTVVVAGALRGEPLPPGVTVEASAAWPRMDHRRWVRHPGCGHAVVTPRHTDASVRVTMAG